MCLNVEELTGKKGGVVPLLAVALTIVLNIGTGVWFASGIEQRMHHVEDRLLDQAHDIGRLDQAREATNLHMSQLDDKFKDIDQKLGAILSIMQDPAPAPEPDSGVETHTAPQQNFQKPPGRR